MAVIVASLFLPYQPQFALDADENEAAQLAESRLVKVNSPAENTRIKRSSSVHSNTPFQPLDAVVTQDLHSPQVELQSNAGTGDVVSSEAFMENLTANATVAASPAAGPMMMMSKNTSADNFFAASPAHGALGGPTAVNQADASQTATRPESTVNSVLSSPGPERNTMLNLTPGNISTASLLNNVNKSLLYQSVLSKNSSQVSLDNGSPSSASSSTVITPKSKALPDVNAAVVNFAKVRQQQTRHAPPSMKRVPISTSKSGAPSNLKFSTTAHEPLSRDSAILESDEESIDYNSDSDLEDDARVKYNVPRFGGYSNTAKLKAHFWRSSKELFSQVPWKIVQGSKGNGALKNAIETAVAEKTISEPVKWVGTVGIPTDEVPNSIINEFTKSLTENYNSEAVITDDITFKGAYKNFCKQILWPTLHYQIPDNPNSKAFEDHSWNYYQHLNQQFADKIIKLYTVGDTIWIHDYHLMLVPDMVKKALPNAKIGFFLHVSFPSSEVFRCFAQRESILKGILGASFVGFQTKEYARHFLQTSNRLLMADIGEENLKYKGEVISVKHIPIGIDVFQINHQIKQEKILQWRQLIRERWNGKKIILGRDQFDRIRGLEKKMLAFEKFLKDNPQNIDKVVLIQICLGSTKDAELERHIMKIVDRINALSPDISISQPVVFLHQELDFEQYLAISCEADMFFVDAFREGMNLTCHEFIACSEEKNSPLLLSEFTGSADVLKNGALLINPWDIRSVARQIKKGLQMTNEEKRRSWKKMMKSIINNDSDNWICSSLQNINFSWEYNQEISRVFYLSSDELYADYTASKKHMFIFKLSQPPTARMISILNDLTVDNIVFIIANFSKSTLESLYSRVVNLGLIAENGAYVRLDNVWYNIVEQVNWKSEVVKILNDKVERLPGSYYKIGESMIRFHTENAEDQDRVAGVVGEAIAHINTLFSDRGIHAYIHKNVVFVQQANLSLSAAQFILRFFNSSSSRSENGTVPTTPIRSNNSLSDYFSSNPSTSQQHVDFLCVTGSSSPVIEPLFQLVKQELANKRLSHGHSIVYGSITSTLAKEHIDGSSELFTMLEHITKLVNY